MHRFGNTCYFKGFSRDLYCQDNLWKNFETMLNENIRKRLIENLRTDFIHFTNNKLICHEKFSILLKPFST